MTQQLQCWKLPYIQRGAALFALLRFPPLGMGALENVGWSIYNGHGPFWTRSPWRSGGVVGCCFSTPQRWEKMPRWRARFPRGPPPRLLGKEMAPLPSGILRLRRSGSEFDRVNANEWFRTESVSGPAGRLYSCRRAAPPSLLRHLPPSSVGSLRPVPSGSVSGRAYSEFLAL